MISPQAAWDRIEEHLEPLAAVSVARRAALGCVLARPLSCAVDVPPADVSAMDGYVVSGPVRAGARLPVDATIAAGDAPGYRLPVTVAARIMTGAPVPAQAHAVVPVEDTDGGDREVGFTRDSRPGAHIRCRAEIAAAGDPLLAPGHLVTPGALSLIATHGYREIVVHRAPTVATLGTGDEIVPADRAPGPGQLRDSHTDFLLAAGRGLGIDFRPLGLAPDDPGAIGEKIRRGLAGDVLLITGGVSKGEFDHVKEALAGLGCRALFEAVAVQPGKPLVVARHAGGWVCGLPGNPASVMVCFWLFVRPLLRRLMGLADGYWQGALAARLDGELPGAKARDRFLPAEIAFAGGEILARPAPTLGSHDVAAYARGNALVRVPARSAPAPAGGRCEILPLVNWPPTGGAGRGATAGR